jgi:hypothetical protein
MLFRYSSEVIMLAGHFGKHESFEFCFDSPRPISVLFAKSYPDGGKPRESGDAVCTSTTTTDPPNAEIAARLKDGWVLPIVDGKVQKDDPTVEFIDSVFAQLRLLMLSTISAFRWRQGIAEGPPDPCRNRRGWYSEDGIAWREVSLVRSISLRFGLVGHVPAHDASEQVVAMVKAGLEEPLARQLFREAWSQRESRPRSALVIGVAAAEVGFKRLVGTLVPHAQWLVDEVQTPPLIKMLSRFLPTLPVKARIAGKSIRPPKVLLKRLQDAVEHRNKLVHAGESPPNRDELDEMLRAVNDLLWICDLHQGHVWASKYISVPVQKAWESDDVGKAK